MKYNLLFPNLFRRSVADGRTRCLKDILIARWRSERPIPVTDTVHKSTEMEHFTRDINLSCALTSRSDANIYCFKQTRTTSCFDTRDVRVSTVQYSQYSSYGCGEDRDP